MTNTSIYRSGFWLLPYLELRVLLSGHLDPEERSPASDAAWLAYTLRPSPSLSV